MMLTPILRDPLTPTLDRFGGYDIADYIVGNRGQRANLEKDFPARLQKPIDTPYGSYADGLGSEQHIFGPFEPVRAKVAGLAAQSRTVTASEPDNGSGNSH
jgi:thiosulfate dehydrogenase